MRVRTRNRIIRTCHALIGSGALLALCWMMYHVSPKRTVIHVAVTLGVIVAGLVGYEIFLRRARNQMNKVFDGSSVKRTGHAKMEEPLPIVPHLARNKEELFAGLIAVGLIVTVFALSWAGVFEKWFGKQSP
jgi:hypothetical protein